MESKEQIARMIDERVRDLAHLGESDVKMAAKISELETTSKYVAAALIDFRKDMSSGFEGINKRLDKQNGYRAEHEIHLNALDNRMTSVESTWNALKLFVPILGAIGAALIIAQLTGGP